MHFKVITTIVVIFIGIGWLGGCASGLRRFPDKAPLWEDPDKKLFSPRPEDYTPATFYEVLDFTVFRAVSRMFLFEGGEAAENVNALDEVPNSSWFTNRLGRENLTPEEVAQGPCTHPIDPNGPFEVMGGKPDGMNPGFLVKAKDGRRYFFKFDSKKQPERATSGDVIGSLIFHAAGFHTPCNEVIFFDPKSLIVSKKARVKRGGKKVPMTQADINKAFEEVKPRADGKVRGSASLFLVGRPIGPWTWEGRRGDDPNDIIDHEDRRELRGSRLLAAWINHFDTRDQNTLAMWVHGEDKNKGYVKHHIIDFGDSFGSLWDWDEVSRRHGQSYLLDFGEIVKDFASLGLTDRRWDDARYGRSGEIFAYYNVENFYPEKWLPSYPITAFQLMTEHDGAWMARIMAEFTDAHIEALVKKGKFARTLIHKELVRILKGRRDKILKRWFRTLSPLSHPKMQQIDGKVHLCLRDLSTFANLIKPKQRVYSIAYWNLKRHKKLSLKATRQTEKHLICSNLEDLNYKGRYNVVDFVAGDVRKPHRPAARVHLYRLGKKKFRIVGLERPDKVDAPL